MDGKRFFRDKRDDHFGSTGFPASYLTVTAQALGAIPHNNSTVMVTPFGVVRYAAAVIRYHQTNLIIAL